MRHLTIHRLVVVLMLLTLRTAPLNAVDKTSAREFISEPPTLLSLGFEWRLDGDDNRNATVAVSYCKPGEQTWKQGLPLLRIGNERINENSLHYVVPNGFAGSIFDLEPATEYECRFVMSDPDGIDGKTENIVTVRTRVEPKSAAGGKTYHVYPPGYNGQKQEPSFTGLLGAYYTGRAAPTTSTHGRHAFRPVTRFWSTPAFTKMIGIVTAAASAPYPAARTF